MSSTKKIVIIFTCIFAAAVIGVGIIAAVLFRNGIGDISNAVGAGNMNISENSPLDLAGITDLRVDCAAANIHFVESDEAGVTLEGTVLSPVQQQRHLNVSKDGGTLHVRVEQSFFSFCLYSDVDLTVYLPKENGLDVSVYCSSGNIDMTGMRFGNLVVSRSSGNLKIDGCAAASLDSDASSGDTYISASALGSIDTLCHSGNTTISGTSGTMTVRSTSGIVSITGASGALDVGCTSGDVSIDMAGSDIPAVKANVTSGNIRFSVPRDAAFDLVANVTSGDITSDIGVTVSGSLPGSIAGDSITGECNGGGETVSLTVTSGVISVTGK